MINNKNIIAVILMLAGSVFSGSAQQLKENVLPKWALGGFERPLNVNPVISPLSTTLFSDPNTNEKIAWESNDTFNPAAAVINGKIVVLYRAEDHSGVGIGRRTSRLGYAESKDGLYFERRAEPVFYPAPDWQQGNEWPGGTEDPRIAQTEDGLYVMLYTQWNRDTPRLGVATSKDLIHWIKNGPAFAKSPKGRNIINRSHKSASLLTKIVNGKQVIAKINGKYWMYWGEEGVYGASSENLIDWEPVVDENNNPIPFISPRDGFFDSQLTECGPPAIWTENGIVLLYNGKNHETKGDKRFNKNAYCAGQVLFDSKDPTKVLARLDVPFLRPMEDFEKSGQYIDGTVFIEGLVYHHKKWFLYYGCADSKVAVAVYDPSGKKNGDPIPVIQAE
ncbi:glycoside hydrolase family 130 protein [Daejeonia sp. YH14]|uniref:glycoside hydrolase family 130 protein n=1 Tax=Daejeonia sp. YH14 TaxID=3439042 RepID=UPI003F496069